jgi:cellulose synthase/poly-beta-1,6-N-acetylglucosamine synthase-like glycosyltransferase
MAQAGRWRLFRLCTIPGTNFMVRRFILEDSGGWDIHAVAEDTELSFRIYQMGYEIAFAPLAETYEQEPETLRVWFKQRTRWVNGNIYVLVKYLKDMFNVGSARVLFDLYYYFSVYFLFLSSIIVSDVIFLIAIFTGYQVSIIGNFFLVWILTYLVFTLQISIALSIEKGEINLSNVLLILLMYFTYCQLWLFVSFYGFYRNIRDRIMKRTTKWYKTERF